MIRADEILAIVLIALLIAAAGRACRQDRILDCMTIRGDMSRASYEVCRGIDQREAPDRWSPHRGTMRRAP